MPLPIPTPAAAATRAFNALLDREPWARDRLQAHAGKTARLVLGGLTIAFGISAAGHVTAATDDVAPDVVLTVATDKLSSLMSDDPARRMSAVRIDGDAALAHTISDLARDLRWDVEEDLAGVVGDVAALRLVSGVRAVNAGVRDGAWRLAENLSEYVTEEAGLVASAPALAAWSAEVRRLRDATERADKRFEALRRRVDALTPGQE
jgi:ubiquinone biosynthesis protein UbiJ